MSVNVHVDGDDPDDPGADYQFVHVPLPTGTELSQCQLCRALTISGDETEHAAWHHRLRMAHNIAGAGIFGALMGRTIRDTI